MISKQCVVFLRGTICASSLVLRQQDVGSSFVEMDNQAHHSQVQWSVPPVQYYQYPPRMQLAQPVLYERVLTANLYVLRTDGAIAQVERQWDMVDQFQNDIVVSRITSIWPERQRVDIFHAATDCNHIYFSEFMQAGASQGFTVTSLSPKTHGYPGNNEYIEPQTIGQFGSYEGQYVIFWYKNGSRFPGDLNSMVKNLNWIRMNPSQADIQKALISHKEKEIHVSEPQRPPPLRMNNLRGQDSTSLFSDMHPQVRDFKSNVSVSPHIEHVSSERTVRESQEELEPEFFMPQSLIEEIGNVGEGEEHSPQGSPYVRSDSAYSESPCRSECSSPFAPSSTGGREPIQIDREAEGCAALPAFFGASMGLQFSLEDSIESKATTDTPVIKTEKRGHQEKPSTEQSSSKQGNCKNRQHPAQKPSRQTNQRSHGNAKPRNKRRNKRPENDCAR